MSRHRFLRVAVILGVLSGCGSIDEERLLSVSAPGGWLGAKVELNGQEVAELGEMMTNTGLMGALFRRLSPDSPLQDLVAVNLPLGSWQLEAGQHEIVVEVVGGARQSVKFRYPFREGATHCLVYVDASDTVVGEACAVTRPAG